MNISFSILTLVGTFILSLFLGLLNLWFWRAQNEDRTPLWMAAWMNASSLFVLCRLLQFSSLSKSMSILIPRILLSAAYSLGWIGYGLGNTFINYRPSRWERILVILSVAIPLIFLWSGNLILTDQTVVRTVALGEKFTGVQTGYLYIPASILILVLGAIPIARLGRISNSHRQDARLMAAGFSFVILFSLNDFIATAFTFTWVRLSDFSYLPVAIFFSYIQIQRFGRLYSEMNLMVSERTVELVQANKILQESEERYRKLIHTARDVIFTVSTNGTFTSLNPSFEIFTGWQRDDWLGRSFDELIAKEDRQRAQDLFNRVLQAESLRAIRLHVRTHEGKMLVVELNVSPQVENDKVVGLLGIARDITEKQRAEDALRESEAQYRRLVEHSPYGIVVHVQGKVVYANPASVNLIAAKNVEELISKPVIDFVHPDSLMAVLQRLKEMSEGKAVPPLQEKFIALDGRVIDVEVIAYPFIYHNDPAVQVVFHDITEHKQAVEEIRRRAEEMTTLYEITHDLVIEQDLSKLLYTIVERAVRLLEASSGGMYLCEPQQHQLRCVVSYNTPQDYTGTILKYGEGAAGLIAETGESLIVDDYRTWDRRASVYEEDHPFISLLSVPIIWQDQIIGVLHVLENSRTGAFVQKDLQLLTLFANQAAIAIANSQLFEAEQSRRIEADVIAEIVRDILSTLQLDAVLERIVVHAKNLLNAETSAVYLHEPSEIILHAIVATGPDAEEIKNDPLKIGEGILGRIAKQKVGEIVNESTADPRGITIAGTENIPHEHLMGVPVLSGDKLMGLIAVWRTGEEVGFKQTELEFLSKLAGQIAVAIENAQLFEETEKRLREAEAISQVGFVLGQTLELKPLLENILETVIHAIFAAERGSTLLADDEGNLHIRAVCGYTDPHVLGFTFPPDQGYASLCFREQRAILVPDVRADDFIRYDGDIPEMLSDGSAMAAPLIVKEQVIGVIALDTSSQINAFKDSDLYLLQTIASSTALAIENARLFERTRQRLSEIEAVHTVSTALRSAQNFSEALPIILDQLIKLLNAGSALVDLLDSSTGEIVTELAYGVWEPMTGLRTPEDVGGSGLVISTGQSYISNNLLEDGFIAHPDLLGGVNAAACVPVISQHQPIGTLWIGRKSPILDEEVSLLEAIGEMVGNAIHRMRLHEQTETLLGDLQYANRELSKAYDTTLEGWAKALELRDKETEGHSRRVTELTLELARQMGVPGTELIHIHRGILLHDIGKMGVPDQILKKTGLLGDEEWVEMRKHPQYAYDLIHPITYLRPALDIPYCHHERWDGSGYPRGLKGKNIPLAARIFAVVDVWDALINDRPYRKAWTEEQTLGYIKEHSGILFDPQIVEKFFEIILYKAKSDN